MLIYLLRAKRESIIPIKHIRFKIDIGSFMFYNHELVELVIDYTVVDPFAKHLKEGIDRLLQKKVN